MPQNDTKIHIITELLAVFVVAPLLIYIGLQQKNGEYELYGFILILIGLLTLALDGYLLSQYQRWSE
jgi:hypothetical protein